MNIATAAIVLVILGILYALMWQEVASVRRQVDQHRKATEAQTRVLIRMGQAAGWLPPDPPRQ